MGYIGMSFKLFLQAKRREILASLLIQLAITPFLAQGYDFRVNVVAGRNVVSGISPCEGGLAPSG